MPASDPFELFSGFNLDTLTSPALSGFTVTPHDANELPYITRAVFIGTGGDICCILKKDDTPILLKNIPDGTMLPLRIKKILATGTTAADMAGLL